MAWPSALTRKATNCWAVGLMLGGLHHAGARDVEHVAGIVGREGASGRVHGRRAHLLAQPVPVVVVDQAELDLALVDLRHQRLVVGVGVAPALRLDRLEPRRAAAVPWAWMIEVTMGWKSVSLGARPSLPFHLGSARSSTEVGSSRRLERRRCCRPARDPGRDAHPVPAGRAVPVGDRGQGGRVDRGQQPLGLQRHERRRVLGVEDVGRRARALLGDLLGQDVLVVVAHLHVDAGLLASKALTSASVVSSCWPL